MPESTSSPLLGLTVVVTREARKAAPLVEAFRSLGAGVVACPTIEIVGPPDPAAIRDAFAHLDRYDWIVFTSANGVERTIDGWLEGGRDVQALGSTRIAAIGPATAEALRARALHVDVIPEAYVAESLFTSLDAVSPLPGSRVLLARASIARDMLPDALRTAGATVDVLDVYRTVVPLESAGTVRGLLENSSDLLVTFTSASTVANFTSLGGDRTVAGVRAACIGPITASSARDFGYSVVVEATTFTTQGLVEAVVRWAVSTDGGQQGRSA